MNQYIGLCAAILFTLKSCTVNTHSDPLISGSVKPAKAMYAMNSDVAVTISLTNIAQQKIYAFIHTERNEGATIRVKEEGAVLTPLMNDAGVSFLGEKAILPGKTFEEELLLNKWITFTKPGVYHIECTIPVEVFVHGIHEKEQNRKGVTNLVSASFTITIAE